MSPLVTSYTGFAITALEDYYAECIDVTEAFLRAKLSLFLETVMIVDIETEHLKN